jgi:hypothetical protein
MARGWESKSIEAQQDDAARDRPRRPALTEEQRAIAARRRMLELTRARATDDLSRATARHHRQMLKQALAAIDDQLDKLNR